MIKILKNPFVIGFAVFLLIYIPALFVAGPVTCRDGWGSPSIGRRGACSHHGGVDRWKESLAFFVSLAVAGIAGFKVNKETTIQSSLSNSHSIPETRRHSEPLIS